MAVDNYADNLESAVRYALLTTRATAVCPFHPDVIIRIGDGSAETHVRNPRQSGHRFRRKAATDSDRKRPPNPNEGGHPVDRVRRGALSAI